MMLETELYAERVLARQGVGISEAFGIGSAVPGDGEEILSLEIYSGVLEEQFVLNLYGKSITHSQCFQAKERAVLDVILRTFVLAVGIVDRRSGNIGCIIPGPEIVFIGFGGIEKLGAVISCPEREEIGVEF